jgi:hypothetical protein
MGMISKAPAPFRVPQDGLIYADELTERCVNLINYTIWAGMDTTSLRRWLKNFTTDEEKYFAACLLDALIFRSEDQTISLIHHLFQRILPDLNRSDPMPLPSSFDLAKLKKKSAFLDPGLRLVPVVRRSDAPTKSGYVIARYMKRELQIDERIIINPWEIPAKYANGIKTFLFIDDILATGDQFVKFLVAESLEPFLQLIYGAYVPLVAHTKGIHNLTQRFPDLRIRAVEKLDNSFSLFHDDCDCFNDGLNGPTSAKFFYYELLKKKNITITGPDRRGFGHLELAYVFSHAAPDNCLPLFWYSDSATWFPLFKR